MSWLLAHARSDVTVVTDTVLLATLPVGWLGVLSDLESSSNASNSPEITEVLAIFERWGLRTLGDVASLPRADVLARLGPIGQRLHQAACGEDASPFVPMDEPATFAEGQELEWPIEELEPLAFVLSRLCDRLSLALRRADRGAVTIRTSLGLVTRETHERTLHLPSPMAESRILRTLILLDLESHPPPAAIDVVAIDLEVSPGPIAQGSLMIPTLPAPEDLATLVARLTALVGASRVGAPVVLDTHDARDVGMAVFRAEGRGLPSEGKRQRAKGKGQGKRGREEGTVQGEGTVREEGATPLSPHTFDLPSALCPLPSALRRPALRRFRLPIAARVDVEHRMPVRVTPSARGLSGGRVVMSAGPWRSSGGWWSLNRVGWDRDEWDVELATGDVYRIARDRSTGQWEIEGILD
jgi:protein ImuB